MTKNSDTKDGPINIAEALLGPPLARGQSGDTAILCEDEAVTYGQLADRTNRAGQAFRAMGVGAGDRVLLMVQDRPIFFYAYLGLLKIGAVPVALSLRLAPKDLAFIIDDSECRAVLMDALFLDLYGAIEAPTENRPALLLSDDHREGFQNFPELISAAPGDLEAVMLPADAPGFWMYSSGTTGAPKGVVHSQRTVLAASRLMGEVFEVQPGDRIFCTSKLFFAFSLAHCLFAALQLGATAVLYPGWPDANSIGDVVDRFRPTILLSVPTFFRNMLRDGLAAKPSFKDVRYYMAAGEKLPRSLFDSWMEATGRPVFEGIGATETCFLFIANRPGQSNPGTCGVPTPGTEVKLISQEGEPVTKPEQPGVLWVRMTSVASGYRNLEDRSRAVFRDGWYCTNDMFTFDEQGYYEYQGRSDDMLKISGQWVSPAEIEEYVLKDSRVAEAAVVGVPNQDGLIRLALFMVAPDIGADTDQFEEEMQQFLLDNLSVYKCPRRMFFVDKMPMTATGKLRRYELREMAVDAVNAAGA